MLARGYDFMRKISTRVERTATTTDLSARASLSVAFQAGRGRAARA